MSKKYLNVAKTSCWLNGKGGRTRITAGFPPKMYVTLPSHSSKKEFPNNHASSFKIRLAEPLRLIGEGWQVGLASISIPDRGLTLTHMTPYDQPIFQTYAVRQKKDKTFTYKFHELKLNQLKDVNSIRDGVSFMKSYLHWLEHIQGQDFRREYESSETYGQKHTLLKFTWEGDDLMMDNSKVVRVRFPGVADPTPSCAFNSVFGIKMGWVRTNDKNEWVPGANLEMMYYNHAVPNLGQRDFQDKDGDPLYMRYQTDNNGVTWFYLSLTVSWKFTNLNVAFDKTIKQPTRSLHVYSDVSGSSMVGSRFTDLLREVNYPRQGQGKVYFEPKQIHYLPLRREVIDITEVNITENTEYGEELVKWKEDHTIVTLHFKKAAE